MTTKMLFLPSVLLSLACLCAAEAPFACNLKAFQPGERTRHDQLTRQVMSAVTSRHELADGYAFEIDPGAVSVAELAEWTVLERRCCPFFNFEIGLNGEEGTLSLSLRGRPGVKQFIESEFRRETEARKRN